MAYVQPVKGKDGKPTSYRVKWRLGGGRDDPWQGENFEDEVSAGVFRDAVNACGQLWPEGWVKGKGYVEPEPEEARYRFERYALESVRNRTGVEGHYKAAIEKELRTYILPTFGQCDVRSTEDFCKRSVQQWVNAMSETMVWRGSVHRRMSPKTIKNLHGLLSSILKEATLEEPPLRDRNPCSLVRLPRTDDGGIEADGSDEDMCFLEPEEVRAIVAELERPEDQVLVRRAYATGLRWSELTALTKRSIVKDTRTGKVWIRVTRAWKRLEGGGYYEGVPKTTRSKRRIRIDEVTYRELLDGGLEQLSAKDLIHHNGAGGRLPYSTFYDRWMTAVRRAHKAGTLPEEKRPALHDLRHSHASALLSAGRSLLYVQRRLGHESITTTSDRYGHLLAHADDDAMETIVETLGGAPAGPESDVEEVPYELSERAAAGTGRKVFVVHLDGGHREGFWRLDDAQAVAEQWGLDRGTEALVEAWSSAWWTRSVTGGRGGGLMLVRGHVPDRVQVWAVGPTLYDADGAEQVESPDALVPRSRWVWEWEEGYTDEPAASETAWRPDGYTAASACGTSRRAVVAAFEQARADALRVCSLNPARPGAPVLEG